MMAAEHLDGTALLERLPEVRGRLTADASLAKVAWFRVGGPADALFRPADQDDLTDFLAKLPRDVPVTLVGVASNLLVRDGGVPGVVVRLIRGFADIQADPDGETVTAGAGALDLNVAATAQQAALGGLEFLCGVPGTVGGALRMNAGAYGTEVKDVLLWAEAVHRDGAMRRFTVGELGYGYRHCTLDADWIFVRACFRAQRGEAHSIARRMGEVQRQRNDSQPVKTRTGGSTFKNPPGMKAWELIERAGCRGLTLGGAQVSEKHCNFLINTGTATAADLEDLGEEVRRRVADSSGVRLEWEIRRIGERSRGGAE